MNDYDVKKLWHVHVALDSDSHAKVVRDAIDALTRLQSEVERLRGRCEKAEARADNCEREARQWRQEARTQSSIVREIYQELTGKTGEPGDWNGARPLKPAILRKQAEAVEAAIKTALRNLGNADLGEEDIDQFAYDYAQRLRQQAAEIDK